MRRLLAKAIVYWTYAGLRQGNSARARALFSRQGRLTFAGTHSWSADTTDAATRNAWFERFAVQRPQLHARDVLVTGPLWAMRIAVRFDDAILGASGDPLYSNRGMQYLVTRWGRVVLDEVHLDTQKVAALDELQT
jgi:ketosteroid isomerase-like protein